MWTTLFAVVFILAATFNILAVISDYTPPGIQALLDAWSGTSPQPAQLAVMALITVLAGAVAARRFRWE